MANGMKDLVARLRLDTTGFTKGMRSLQSDLKRVGAAMAVAAGGVAVAIKQQLNAADEMSKNAQRLGVPIETLSKLRHAADMSGVSFEQLSVGLKTMSRNMAEAMGGNKTAMKIFADLGVSATDAQGKMRSTEAVMQDVAEQLSKMPDGAQKTALAMKLFGESGAALLPMLNGGAAGLAAMMKEAESLGIVFDENTAKAAERFNDNIARIGKAMNGLVIRITASLAPALKAVSDLLVASLQEGSWLREIVDLLPRLATYATAFVGTLAAWRVGMAGVAAATTLATGSMVALRAAMARTGIGLFIVGMGELGYQGLLVADRIGGIVVALYKLKAKFFEVLRGMAGGWVDFTWMIADGMNALLGTTMIGASAEITQKLGRMQIEAEKAAEAAKGFGDAASDAGNDIEQMATKVDNATGGGSPVAKGMEKLKQAAGEMKSAFQSAFTSLVTGAASFKEALRQLAQQLAQMLANSAFNSIWSALVGGGSGGTGTLGLPMPFAKGGVFQGGRVAAFAKGGVVAGATAFAMQGGLGVMGEAGPEAIMPLSRGADGKLGVKAQGGGVVHVLVEMDSSGNLSPVIRQVAGNVVAQAIVQYDREALPRRLQQINRNPRKMG